MITEKLSGLKKFKLDKKSTRILSTAIITFAVFLFFLWLGIGMYISVPAEKRAELWPVFAMYGVFPGLIFFFGIKRVHGILIGEEDQENFEPDETGEEETE